KMNFDGPQVNEPVFISGHPGTTERLLTVAQLKSLRDRGLPRTLILSWELRGRYLQFAKTSLEARRMIGSPISALENTLKVRRKQEDALLSDDLMMRKMHDEKELRAKVSSNPELAKTIGDPWADLARAEELETQIDLPYSFIEGGGGFSSRLFGYAKA